MSNSTPMPMCPMAGACKAMMEKPASGRLLLIAGLVFIILGVMVLVEPRILLWLVALTLIGMGVAALMLARFMRRIGVQMTG